MLALSLICAATSASAFPLPWRRAKAAAPPAAAPSRATAANSAIRQGRLANGLAWAVEPIAGEPLSLRLYFSGRAVEREPNAAALAAILQRLPFDSLKTRHGEARALAAAQGLAFSLDETAEPIGLAGTSWRFDGVKAGEGERSALTLLRAIAEPPRPDQRAIDRARDAVAAEARSPLAARRRIYLARAAFLLGTEPSAGAIEPPAHVTRASRAAFGESVARPDAAVLVIAGDIDPGVAEQEITQTFGDWRARARGPAPAAAPPMQGGPRASAVVDAGAPTTVQLSWFPAASGEAAAGPGAVADRLAVAVMNARLAGIGGAENQAVFGAALLDDDALGPGIVSLLAGAEPGRWREALASLDAVARRAVAGPVGADELAAASAAERARLAGRTAAPLSGAEAADALAADLAGGRRPTTPAEDLASFDRATVTPEDIRQAATALFAGAGPLIFVTTPAPIEGAEGAILAAYQEAHATPLATVQARPAPLAWPYEDVGPPGAIATRREVADVGAVFVGFENGVRLIVEPTKLAHDANHVGEVRVKLLAGSGLPPGLDGTAVIRAGLKKIAFGDIAKVLPGVRFSADLAVENGAAAFTGVTNSEDLESQLRVLTAYLVDPARPPPSASGETAGPIEAIVVGDVTPEKAIAAVAATLGTLPPVAGKPPPAPPEPSAAESLLRQIVAAGGDARAPSAAEVEAARAALLARMDRDERSNAWWLSALDYVDIDPARLAHLRTRRAALLRVTVAEVRSAMRR